MIFLMWMAGLAHAAGWFTLEVQDASGQPAGCVTLRTPWHTLYTTDADGLIAFYEPGLMGEQVFFQVVDAPGYSVDTDWIGIPGAWVDAVEGGHAVLDRTLTPDGSAPPACTRTDQGALLAGPVPDASDYLAVEVYDAETGRGVPLAFLEGEHGTWITDSAGRAAIYHPDLPAGASADFTVWSHGYAHDTGSISLTIEPGGRVEVPLHRQQVAERLYRVSGVGIYRDSALLGLDAPLEEPLLAGEVAGMDGGMTGLWRGEVVWLMGDTNWIGYALGNFHTTMATSALPEDGGLDPDLGVDLQYVEREDGFVAAVADFAESGLVWPGPPIALHDGDEEILVTTWMNVQSLEDPGIHGTARYDEATRTFVPLAEVPGPLHPIPSGPALRVQHGASEEWLYFYGGVRMPADLASFSDPSTFEAFTPVDSAGEMVFADDGRLDWRWRTGAPSLDEEDAYNAVLEGTLAVDQLVRFNMRDPWSGEAILDHNGDIQWNPWRGRYVRIFTQAFGETSGLGETWYAEADTPLGPWAYARKVVTFDDYDLYNPVIHPLFTPPGSSDLYFHGSYTNFFEYPVPYTPYYNYNLLMHRVDLEDEALVLPVPVYALADGSYATRGGLHRGDDPLQPAFFAADRPGPGLVAVGWSDAACASPRLQAGEVAGEILFYALPADASEGPDFAVPLPGEEALARVWPNPIDVDIPVGEYLGPVAADAGPDQCLTVAEGAEVVLDASATDAWQEVASWTWSWEGGEASGQQATISLEPGLHAVTLMAVMEDGTTDTDTVMVRVGSASEGEQEPGAEGCGGGCRVGGGGGIWSLPLALLAVLRRRRR